MGAVPCERLRQKCGKLNEEDSKFCQECGNPL
ncbi:MAG: zinc-ribbon domain-containing protein [Pirellulales bacterium]|nr:zinc-ribbon domain-containing protein [Pirellulales bacterium]